MLNLSMSNFIAPNGETNELVPVQVVRSEITDRTELSEDFTSIFQGEISKTSVAWPPQARALVQKHLGPWAGPFLEGAEKSSALHTGRLVPGNLPEEAAAVSSPAEVAVAVGQSAESAGLEIPVPRLTVSAASRNSPETGVPDVAHLGQMAAIDDPQQKLPDLGEGTDGEPKKSVSKDDAKAFLKAPAAPTIESQMHSADEAPEPIFQGHDIDASEQEEIETRQETVPGTLSDAETTPVLQTHQTKHDKVEYNAAAKTSVAVPPKTEVARELHPATTTVSEGLPNTDPVAKDHIPPHTRTAHAQNNNHPTNDARDEILPHTSSEQANGPVRNGLVEPMATVAVARTDLTAGPLENPSAAFQLPKGEKTQQAPNAISMPSEPETKSAIETPPAPNSGPANPTSVAVQGMWPRTDVPPFPIIGAAELPEQSKAPDNRRSRQAATIAMKPVLAVAQAPASDLFTAGLTPSRFEIPEAVAEAGAEFRVADAGAHSTAAARIGPQNPLPLAQHVVRQIVEITARNPDRPVELTLNPEELGRVRLTLATSDTGVSVSILTERPETLEILRRNISILAEEFRLIGYRDLDFNFDRQSPGHADQENAHDPFNPVESDSHPDRTEAENSAIVLDLGSNDGVDIRL